MKGLFKVGCWGKPSKVFLLELDHSRFRRISEDDHAEIRRDGMVKFFFGRPVFLLEDDGGHFVWTPRNKEPMPLIQIKISSVRRLLVFRELRLNFEGWHDSFFQFDLASLYGQLDPTYDDFDRWATDFIYNLVVTQKKDIEKRRAAFG